MGVAQPTVVLIPGAFHAPGHYADLVARLDQAGYPVMLRSLPSSNPKDPQGQSFIEDAAYIRDELLLPTLQRGTDVLLVMHSYGGVPGSSAAEELNRSYKASHQMQGRILGLIGISAFLLKEGMEVHKLDPPPFTQV